MGNSPTSFVSSASRPLLVQARPDLQLESHCYYGDQRWVVKDPVSLQYYLLGEEEHALLQALQGTASLQELREKLEGQFQPRTITFEQISAFISSLYSHGLLVNSAPLQGPQLLLQQQQTSQRQWWSRLTNPLCIRLQGVDPESFFRRLYPLIRWMYAPWCLAACLLLILMAAVLVLVQWPEFHRRLPAFDEFFQSQNLVWLAVALGLAKVLHELGHGLSCRHFGGECHELGLMFLVFTPCLYCEVSDSWMLPNKWNRMAIGAAGMLVELVLAAVCTFLWWFSEPGLLNMLCLRLVFVCSVSTVFFNLNPLMRYDGYYILSDLLEIPNLAPKSQEVLRHYLSRWFLGLDFSSDSLPSQRRWLFGLYAVAALMYRLFVMVSIVWFLNQLFKPYQLNVLGHFLTLFVLLGTVLIPLWQVFRFLTVPGRFRQMKFVRMFFSFSLLLVILALLLCWPISHQVSSPFTLELADVEPVYVTTSGELQEVKVRADTACPSGKLLARLSNPDLDLELADLEANFQRQEIYLENLKLQRVNDPAAADQIPLAEQTLADLLQRLNSRRRDLLRLELRAPVAGYVLAPPNRPAPSSKQNSLRTWCGNPLEPRNLGSFLEVGTLLCWVGDPQQKEAVLVIDQQEIEFLQPGQPVKLLLEQRTSTLLHGEILEAAKQEVRTLAPQLSQHAGGEIATQRDDAGQERPLTTCYRVRVRLTQSIDIPYHGARGHALVHVGSQTLAQWLYRFLSHTFHFHW